MFLFWWEQNRNREILNTLDEKAQMVRASGTDLHKVFLLKSVPLLEAGCIIWNSLIRSYSVTSKHLITFSRATCAMQSTGTSATHKLRDFFPID